MAANVRDFALDIQYKLRSNDNYSQQNGIDSRFPDYGPCEVEEWKGFLLKAKEQFYEKWGKPFTHKETLTEFHQVELLGRGSFGKVILIKHKWNGKYYAMKMFDKEKIIKQMQLGNTKSEKLVLQCINFPFTVYLIYCFKDNSYLYFVMPYISGGEVFELLTRFRKFDEALTRFYISQVILAIEYLHYLDLIYRDIKPENIIIDRTGYLKLTDFGFCKRMTRERTYTLCGTPEYLAPEIVMNKGYGKAVDWWGVGVLMYEFSAGVAPFTAKDPLKIYEKIVNIEYKMPSFFSTDLKDLVKNILQIDLSKRFGNLKNGVDDIKNHNWFKTTNWKAVLNRKVDVPYRPIINEDSRRFRKTDWFPPRVAKENKYSKEFADF